MERINIDPYTIREFLFTGQFRDLGNYLVNQESRVSLEEQAKMRRLIIRIHSTRERLEAKGVQFHNDRS